MVEDPQGARVGAPVLDDADAPGRRHARAAGSTRASTAAPSSRSERDGSIAWSVGDPDVGIYARSALKPLQAAAMVAAGLTLPDQLLAVVCASHDGRPEHLAAVREILAGAGLSEDDLENTPTLPLDPDGHARRHPARRRSGCRPPELQR